LLQIYNDRVESWEQQQKEAGVTPLDPDAYFRARNKTGVTNPTKEQIAKMYDSFGHD
jgi:hypothetical protein